MRSAGRFGRVLIHYRKTRPTEAERVVHEDEYCLVNSDVGCCRR